jgi:small GTP-binding protein
MRSAHPTINLKDNDNDRHGMKHVIVGVLAHVDAGKTTLCEGLLYRSGQMRSLGRVDHGDAFLDTDAMEKRRGITIFSKQAIIQHDDVAITMLDTPGHVDFSAEMERTLGVLDYAILVVSATDGVQGYTQTLWRLLERYQVPTFIFVNKMDAAGADRAAMLAQFRRHCSDDCMAFDNPDELAAQYEDIATLDEHAMDEYLDRETLSDATVQSMIARRLLFPCYFGSALQLDGIDTLLDGLQRYTQQANYPQDFGAKVYKISHENQGNRLTWLKVTGGALPVKTMLTNARTSPEAAEERMNQTPEAEPWQEKADQIRIYSGAKFELSDTAQAGSICAVTGLTQTFPGEGLGCEPDAEAPVLEPVLTYTVIPGETDTHKALVALRTLEDEDPMLHVRWQERLQEIQLQLMGAVQLEVVQQLMHDRFGLDVSFGPGGILYRENHHAAGGRRRAFRAATPLCRSSSAARTRAARQRAAIRLLMQRRCARSQLAAADHDPSARTRASGSVDRLADCRYAHYAPDRARPSQAHRGRRFPPGHLPRRAPGPDESQQQTAVPLARTVVSLPA